MEKENIRKVESPEDPTFGSQKPSGNASEPGEQKDPDPTPAKAQPAKYIRRSDWGAKPPKWIESLQTPVKKVVLTWTETDACSTEEECMQRVKEIQEEHMKDEDCPDIRHNFLVGGDGALYEGRGYTRVGPKYPKSDKTHEELYGKSIEIAFIQRHEMALNQVTTEPVRACLGIGVDLDFLVEGLEFIYVKNGKTISKDINTQLNEMEITVRGN